jgi:hypothetical protein
MSINSAQLQRLLKERCLNKRSASDQQRAPETSGPIDWIDECRRNVVLQQTLRNCMEKRIRKPR